MVEAVNSVLANASLSRSNVLQAAASTPAPREPVTLPVAPFISPRVAIDSGSNEAVLQIRDAATGDVVNQFPSESRLRAIQAQQAREVAQSSRQSELTGVNTVREQSAPVQSAAPAIPVQSFDAGSIAALQTPQGVSTSDVQLATVAFTSGAASGAPSTSSVNVTA